MKGEVPASAATVTLEAPCFTLYADHHRLGKGSLICWLIFHLRMHELSALHLLGDCRVLITRTNERQQLSDLGKKMKDGVGGTVLAF